ncbi:VWA domain-containing protein [Streptomyces sp. V3I7]|uniref:VWA domain-containing protein n=1 Tax=Streptomyces sp. V3I7 TaxID=3042278 RepID=UPI0027833764|nr:VWA domain-containing protein [Streptomyces sp. V3I7]MDQ0994704.1 Mg-chelatase subunit ChlD [Streptomyces sp. V3I7]
MGDAESLGLAFTLLPEAPREVAYDETRLDALVTVRAHAGETPAAAAPSAEVLIMDRSLSMAARGKLAAAQSALAAAVDAVRDGTLLGVVAGHHEAEVIYPPGGGLAPVDAAVREAAKARIAAVVPSGGTRIGSWLRRADRLFVASEAASARGTVRHAVLYTDGIDEHETPEELAAALTACADHFVCDARGFGEDWNYREVLRIAQALHGEAEAVVELTGLTEDFTQLMRRVQGIVVPRVYLRLRPRAGFRVVFVRQTYPVEADLAVQREDGGGVRVPLGSWSAQERHYQVSLAYAPDLLTVGAKTRVLRLGLHAETGGALGSSDSPDVPDSWDSPDSPCVPEQHIAVERLPTPGVGIAPPAGLTHAENMRELGEAISDCIDAWAADDRDRADRALRRALGRAEELGDTGRLGALRAVAHQGADGRWRLRDGVPRGEMQALGVLSARTTRPHRPGASTAPGPEGAEQARQPCPHCGRPVAAADAFCEKCGRSVAGGSR